MRTSVDLRSRQEVEESEEEDSNAGHHLGSVAIGGDNSAEKQRRRLRKGGLRMESLGGQDTQWTAPGRRRKREVCKNEECRICIGTSYILSDSCGAAHGATAI